MKTCLKKFVSRRRILIFTFACFAVSPLAQAVVPAPDGCYPNFTTAEGCKALQNLTTGVANTGIGWYSLFATDSGSNNTAVGAGALDLNTADNNTAVGVAALLLNTTGTNNTANGVGALVFNDTGEGNTATGAFALYNNTEGDFNTATGEFALYSNTIGERNTAVGDSALYLNTEGNRNTAIGNPALLNNTTGSDNTAVGHLALWANNSNGNTAIGSEALSSNSSGNTNTATGFRALANNNGNQNTANGHGTLLANITGAANTGVGFSALDVNTTGSGNTAVGWHALAASSTGQDNTALGKGAGSSVVGASNVICIGAEIAGADVDNSCYIGNIWSQPGGSQAVYVNASGKLGAQVSSRRFKDEIQPMDQASEVIYRLNPVSFRYKPEIEPSRPLGFGLIAEEVNKVHPDLVVRDKEGKPYTVRYDQVNAMLLNEFLKEHRKNEEQQYRIDQQDAKIALQQRQIEALTTGLQKVSAQLATSSPSLADSN